MNLGLVVDYELNATIAKGKICQFIFWPFVTELCDIIQFEKQDTNMFKYLLGFGFTKKQQICQ